MRLAVARDLVENYKRLLYDFRPVTLSYKCIYKSLILSRLVLLRCIVFEISEGEARIARSACMLLY